VVAALRPSRYLSVSRISPDRSAKFAWVSLLRPPFVSVSQRARVFVIQPFGEKPLLPGSVSSSLAPNCSDSYVERYREICDWLLEPDDWGVPERESSYCLL
jgi:hypothetical protein